MLIAPNRTRLALPPLIGTGACSPRRAQPARSGGNSRRSVSSSASFALRGDRARSRRRMARFFLALGVRGKHVAEPLPHVAQPVQLPADGVVEQPPAAQPVQVLLEQRHCPVQPGVAQLVGAVLEAVQEQRLQALGPGTGTAAAVAIREGDWVGTSREAVSPVVDALTRHPQQLGDFGNGLAPVQFEDGQQAAVVTGILGAAKFSLELAPERWSQMYDAHGSPPRKDYQQQPGCQKSFAEVLRALHGWVAHKPSARSRSKGPFGPSAAGRSGPPAKP